MIAPFTASSGALPWVMILGSTGGGVRLAPGMTALIVVYDSDAEHHRGHMAFRNRRGVHRVRGAACSAVRPQGETILGTS